jgi:hypothetical protein
MTGPITSDLEWEIERAAWKLRAAQARRNREAPPRRPRRVVGNPRAIVPDGVCVGRLPVRPIREGSGV